MKGVLSTSLLVLAGILSLAKAEVRISDAFCPQQLTTFSSTLKRYTTMQSANQLVPEWVERQEVQKQQVQKLEVQRQQVQRQRVQM